MKVKVIKSYIDKRTRTLHKVGEVLTITKERFEELTSTSRGIFVEEIIVKEEKPKVPKESTVKK